MSYNSRIFTDTEQKMYTSKITNRNNLCPSDIQTLDTRVKTEDYIEEYNHNLHNHLNPTTTWTETATSDRW